MSYGKKKKKSYDVKLPYFYEKLYATNYERLGRVCNANATNK